MASVEFDDVHVQRGGRPVLTGVDLVIADGEAVALLGGSGSGKSTTLRALAGLQDLSSGRVLLDGEDVADVPTKDRDLSMVFQGGWMLPHLTVEGNLDFPLKLRKTPREERFRRIGAELRAFALGAFARRKPRTLSSGERHMAATAQSMVRAPSVLLMDEPVAQVDGTSQQNVLRQIDEVRRGYGCTMLVATNDRRVAAALADRTAVIEQGRIVQVAPLQVLWAEPGTIGVADLVGEWSLTRLLARVTTIPGERVRLRTAAGSLRTWQRDIGRRTTVTVGIRPEEVDVVDPADGELRAVVQRVGPMGARVVLELVATSREPGTMGAQVRLEAVAPAPGPRIGDEVGLRPRAFHLFDEDGRAVGHVRRPT
jgi:ABC-type sugar transport system ATPase subunit